MRKASRVVFLAVFLLIGLSAFASDSYARRLLPSLRPKPKAATGVVSSNKVGISVKFRSDRRALTASFSNLNLASSVSYSLTYDKSNGVGQGADGSVDVSSPSGGAEILFGSCSHGVCNYDTDSGISNARLKVTVVYKDGRKIIKPYRIKV